MAAADVVMSGTDEFELPPRKKPKISELPLSSAQRASIDGMLHTFKKKGEFDALRKKAFQQYNESAKRGMFEASLRTFTTNEIERDSLKYLKPDRRIAAPLLEGAAARANIYGTTEADIDAYIDQYVANAERALREIRRSEIGEEAANLEYHRGKKSDEEYAVEAEQRRHARDKAHLEDEKKRRKQEAQERKKKELEALKKKQEALMKETERLQREQKRRAERDAWKLAEKERERERIRKYNEERERQKKEAEEREKALQEERERRAKERAEREQKRLEAEALDLLLKEGQEMAEKARRPELERSESMEPPNRLKHSSAPKTNSSKDQMRAQGLMPTSLTLRKGDRAEATPISQIPTGPAADHDARPRQRARSPSPARSSYSNRRRDASPDDRRRSGRGIDRRESTLRDISADRAAWKSRQRGGDRYQARSRSRSRSPPRRDRGRDRSRDRERNRPRNVSRGEEGEVVEQPARSKSRESYRPARRDDSRSPPRRRDRSRSRSPVRRRRDGSRRRHERSRSPPGIDRYVPGGAAAATTTAPARRATRDDDSPPPRRRTRNDDDSRERPKIRDSRRRGGRYDRESMMDRYIPGGGSSVDDRPRRRDRSRSRNGGHDIYRGKSRSRSRDRYRDRSPRERERRESKSGNAAGAGGSEE